MRVFQLHFLIPIPMLLNGSGNSTTKDDMKEQVSKEA